MPETGLAERLAAIIAKMRKDSRDSVEQWCIAAEENRGGTLVMQAPCTHRPRGTRDIPQAGFRTELFPDIVSATG